MQGLQGLLLGHYALQACEQQLIVGFQATNQQVNSPKGLGDDSPPIVINWPTRITGPSSPPHYVIAGPLQGLCIALWVRLRNPTNIN